VEFMMTDQQRSNDFRLWLEHVQLPLDKAAQCLGKSQRTARYYDEGHHIPLDVRLLMAAIADGYKPRPWKGD
jgi:hypothetical protein